MTGRRLILGLAPLALVPAACGQPDIPGVGAGWNRDLFRTGVPEYPEGVRGFATPEEAVADILETTFDMEEIEVRVEEQPHVYAAVDSGDVVAEVRVRDSHSGWLVDEYTVCDE